jgi:hypothetical protein
MKFGQHEATYQDRLDRKECKITRFLAEWRPNSTTQLRLTNEQYDLK